MKAFWIYIEILEKPKLFLLSGEHFSWAFISTQVYSRKSLKLLRGFEDDIVIYFKKTEIKFRPTLDRERKLLRILANLSNFPKSSKCTKITKWQIEYQMSTILIQDLLKMNNIL